MVRMTIFRRQSLPFRCSDGLVSHLVVHTKDGEPYHLWELLEIWGKSKILDYDGIRESFGIYVSHFHPRIGFETKDCWFDEE